MILKKTFVALNIYFKEKLILFITVIKGIFFTKKQDREFQILI